MGKFINDTKNLALFLGGAFVMASCSNSSQTLLQGKLDGMEANDSVLVICQNHTDTVAAPNGRFTYEYTDSVPGMVRVYNYPKKEKDGTIAAVRMVPVSVMMFPDVSVSVKGTFDTYKVEGGDFYQQYNEMCAPLDSFALKIMSLRNDLSHLDKEGVSPKGKKDELETAYRQAFDDRMKYIEEYVTTHPDSEVSLFLLYSYSPKIGEEWYLKLSDEVKNGRMKSIYDKVAATYENRIAKRKAAEFIQEGKTAPDFTLTDIQGNDFTLSSLRGKFIVLDFWGSWCGWCIKGMPEMKKAYERYQNKLEIVGIDCRDSEEKWKAAVERLGINWVHVINNTDKEKDLTVKYNINGYPTKLILSPEGTILKIVVGENPVFYEFLDNLMKK